MGLLRSVLSRRAAGAVFAMAMLAGCAVILATTLDYFRGVPHPFVVEKLPLPHEAAWRVTLAAHVASALFALPACLALLSTRLRARCVRVHRWLGRIHAAVVLLVLVPSGFVLALTARGGALASAGFVLSGLVVAAAMVRAIGRARAGDHAEHRRAARHVVAQLSVAVTSRVMLAGFGALGEHGDGAYVVALWVPVLGSAALVEALEPRSPVHAAPRRWARVSFAGAATALLLGVAAAILPPRTTRASTTAATEAAEAQVRLGLVEPLARWRKRRARFTRAVVPWQLELRFPDGAAERDAAGAAFVRFTVDEHRADEHEPGGRQGQRYAGCVYPDTGDIYVTHLDDASAEYHAASWLFGGGTRPAPRGACVAR